MLKKISYPKVMSIELPESHLVAPFSGNIDPASITHFLSQNYYGVVSAKGKWKLEPAAGWELTKPEKGTYKVLHNLGYSNLVLHVSLLVQPGSFNLVFHTPTFFMIETHLNQVPTDFDWMFSMTRVISQPDQQDESSSPPTSS